MIAGIANGDQQAFRLLFRRHYKALCYFASTITLDQPEAEDLVQETFSRLWDKRADFPDTNAIKAFLYISVRNASLNFVRQRNKLGEKEQAFTYLQSAAPDTPDPLLLDVEVVQAVYGEIAQLPTQCRRVFSMSYIEGRKNDEIASVLGISYNTVRTQKLRALKLLRSSLLKKGLLPALAAWMAFVR
ncbi:RNA polymerase sigma factor [Chitinophaga lutea]